MSAFNFLLSPTYLLLILLGPFPSMSHNTARRFAGETVMLRCDCRHEDIVMCFWYKQELGQKPVKISSYNKYTKKGEVERLFRDSRRFTLDNHNHYNHLEIANVQISDAATYFCLSSNLYNLNFLELITVDVGGAGVDFKMLVAEETPEKYSTEEGLVTLDCKLNSGACEGQNRVHWFKQSEEYAAGVLYGHGGGDSDQCERKTDGPKNSCVYSLPLHDKNVTGNWEKCAVASCGRALFGNKQDLSSGDRDLSSVLVYVLSGAVVTTLIMCGILVVFIYKIKKKSHLALTTENEEDIHYAALKHHNSNRPRRVTDSTVTECVYSGVRL